jgi:transposase
MSPDFIEGIIGNLPNALITFDKFRVVAHQSSAVDAMRRIEQKTQYGAQEFSLRFQIGLGGVAWRGGLAWWLGVSC